jgi:hypothetical protein
MDDRQGCTYQEVKVPDLAAKHCRAKRAKPSDVYSANVSYTALASPQSAIMVAKMIKDIKLCIHTDLQTA